MNNLSISIFFSVLYRTSNFKENFLTIFKKNVWAMLHFKNYWQVNFIFVTVVCENSLCYDQFPTVILSITIEKLRDFQISSLSNKMILAVLHKNIYFF